MMHFVTHLEAAIDGKKLPFGQVHGMHNGRPIWVRYDLDAIRQAVTPERDRRAAAKSVALSGIAAAASRRGAGHAWRGHVAVARLPAPGGFARPRSAACQGRIAIADGEFQVARHGGRRQHGQASGHQAAGLADGRQCGRRRGGLRERGRAWKCYVFMPEDTPAVNQMEPYLFGAKAYCVNGLINDCGKLVRDGMEKMGWFDLSTLKEPYRLEGKKTMGLEIAEQLGWRLPDVILYPTGGGTGLIGMWKAFQELQELGWLKSAKMPRLISCQAEGCARSCEHLKRMSRFAELFPNAHTVASGLRVPAAVGDFMMLDAIRASQGLAVAGREAAIGQWMRCSAESTGISICPETAVCFDVLEKLVADGKVKRDEEVLVFNTGAAQKYLEALPAHLPRIEKEKGF